MKLKEKDRKELELLSHISIKKKTPPESKDDTTSVKKEEEKGNQKEKKRYLSQGLWIDQFESMEQIVDTKSSVKITTPQNKKPEQVQEKKQQGGTPAATAPTQIPKTKTTRPLTEEEERILRQKILREKRLKMEQQKKEEEKRKLEEELKKREEQKKKEKERQRAAEEKIHMTKSVKTGEKEQKRQSTEMKQKKVEEPRKKMKVSDDFKRTKMETSDSEDDQDSFVEDDMAVYRRAFRDDLDLDADEQYYEQNYKNIISKLFPTRNSRYSSEDWDSTSDMEAGLDEIELEERRRYCTPRCIIDPFSAAIGRLEDKREEELEKERLRRLAEKKKQKNVEGKSSKKSEVSNTKTKKKSSQNSKEEKASNVKGEKPQEKETKDGEGKESKSKQEKGSKSESKNKKLTKVQKIISQTLKAKQSMMVPTTAIPEKPLTDEKQDPFF